MIRAIQATEPQRGRAQDEDVRRRHGRHRHGRSSRCSLGGAAAAWSMSSTGCRRRRLSCKASPAFLETSVERAGRARRSLGLFPAALRLCRAADAGRRRRRAAKPRSRQGRRLPSPHRLPHRRGRCDLRRGRPMGPGAALWVQFGNIRGNDLEQSKGKAMEVILLSCLQIGRHRLSLRCGAVP
jgi:hypothetical protein